MARPQPCNECPFKVDSEYGYDIDAHEAFHGGENTPACHKQVGLDHVFANAPMDPPAGTECRGYLAWLKDRPGFREPSLVHSP